MNKIIVKSFMFEAVPTIVAPIAINILYLFFSLSHRRIIVAFFICSAKIKSPLSN